MKKHRFYVAVGDNGGVITSTYAHALYCTKYLRGHIYTKGHPDFESAEDYLLEHLIEKAPFDCPVPFHCKLNQVITIRKLLESC